MITPELLEYWTNDDLVNFVLDDEVIWNVPKQDVVMIAKELAIRYDHFLVDEDEEEEDDEEEDDGDPEFYDS